MSNYNLAAEYAAPFILLIILSSFVQDYEEDTLVNRFLKALYFVTFVSSIALITSIHTGLPPQSGIANVFWINVTNTIYLLTCPLPSCFYLMLCVMMTERQSDRVALRNNLFFCITPYLIYATIVICNIGNGLISSASEVQGYIRGDWYLLPFIAVGIHILLIIRIVILNYKYIHKEVAIVIIINMTLASTLALVQIFNSYIILTSVGNISSILALQLYAQSKRNYINQLTGSKNYIALRQSIQEALKKKSFFSIYIISLRDFKSINERNGLEFGDKVLKAITNELMLFFPYDCIYRYAGDEFAIMLKENVNNDTMIQDTINHLRNPLKIDGTNEVDIDFVCAKVDNRYSGSTIQELISAIDFSISSLKQTHGEPRYLYNTNIVEEMIKRTNLIKQIKDSIDNRMLQLCYQPIYSTKTKNFPQAEALVRLIDKTGKIVPPNDFIDIAETTGLVVPMTYVILDIVCEDFRRLINKYGKELALDSISINLPYNLFLSPDMDRRIMDILHKHQIPTNKIKIEITERTLIADSKFMMETMEDMQRKGFVFELDDFGVDYSNMSTLLNLPLDIIKIDRNVLLSALKQPENREFFKHLVCGINETGKVTIVEGIEKKEQLDFILECGCEYIQGFIFSKPLLFDTFAKFLLVEEQKQLLQSFDLIETE